MNGDPLTYSNFADDEPSNMDNGEDCVEMYMNGAGVNGQWNDITCEARRRFVCQYRSGEDDILLQGGNHKSESRFLNSTELR
jgi:hypothetical protein